MPSVREIGGWVSVCTCVAHMEYDEWCLLIVLHQPQREHHPHRVLLVVHARAEQADDVRLALVRGLQHGERG